MGNGNKHNGGVILMRGEFHYHMNLIHRIYPYGLHREVYRVIDINKGLFDDDNIKFIIFRVSTKVLRFKNKNL